MKTFVQHIWSRLRRSFWFVPGLLVTVSIIVAYSAIAADRSLGDAIASQIPRWENASAEGVRSLLSTAAGSVLTLAGLTFSSTLVALTLAASQYGGRLLRNFIRSVPNQISLGILLGNFVFCLIVLRSVGNAYDGDGFIPHGAALLAFVGTILSLGTFIYFIHHIATSLQADNIVSSVYSELDQALDRHFPKRRDTAENTDESEAAADQPKWEDLEHEVTIPATKSGYIQAIAIDTLVADCERLDLRCRIINRPGHFVNEGSGLVAISREKAESLTTDDRKEILEAFLIGKIRTAEQDFEYCLRQLVEVSLRALSPGINDPFTAMNCIDFLGSALAKVAARKLPKRNFVDEDGVIRVRSRPTKFHDLLESAFQQIRQTANGQHDISLRLLGSLSGIGANVLLPEHAGAVLHQAELVAAAGVAAAKSDCDAESITAALDKLKQRFNVAPE